MPNRVVVNGLDAFGCRFVCGADSQMTSAEPSATFCRSFAGAARAIWRAFEVLTTSCPGASMARRRMSVLDREQLDQTPPVRYDDDALSRTLMMMDSSRSK